MQRYRHLLLLTTCLTAYCIGNRLADQTFYGRLLLLEQNQAFVNSCVVNNISLSALVAKRLMRVWEKAVIAAYIVLILN